MPAPVGPEGLGRTWLLWELWPGRVATLPAPKPRVPKLWTEAQVVTIVLASLQHHRLGGTDVSTTAPVAINNE